MASTRAIRYVQAFQEAVTAVVVLTACVASSRAHFEDEPTSPGKPVEILTFAENGKDISKAAGTVGDVLAESDPALVLAIAFSPDGKTLALAGENPSVALREPSTNKTRAVLTAHTAPVTCLAFSPDGTILATGGHDRSIKLWDVASASEKTTLLGHSDWVHAVAFAPGGKVVASASQDGTVKLWEVASARELATLDAHDGPVRALAFAPDGTTLASAGSGRVVRLWDLESKVNKGTWEGHRSVVRALAYSADGATLVSAGEDHLVRIWDAATGKPQQTFSGHSDQVLAVAFSPRGQGLATGGYDSAIKLWDLAQRKRDAISSLDGQNEGITALAFNPATGAIVSSAYDRTVFVWAPTPSAARLHLTLAMRSSMNSRPLFSPDSKTLVTTTDDQLVRFWDVATGKETGQLAGNTGNVILVQFTRDGSKVMTTADDKRLLLWDVASRTLIREIDGSSQNFPRAALAGDGESVAIEGANGSVVLRELTTMASRTILPAQTEVINGLILSPDGTGLLVVLLSANFQTTTIKLLDVADGRVRGSVSLPNRTIFRVRFTPDGKTLAAAVGPPNGNGGQAILFWETSKLADVAKVPVDSAALGAFNISADGKIFALGNARGLVTFWDLATRVHGATLKAHQNSLASLAFSPDGRRLVTVGNNQNQPGEVKVWDLNLERFSAMSNENRPTTSKK